MKILTFTKAFFRDDDVITWIAEDLRKAGYMAGIGLIGAIIENDNITLNESLILFGLGLILWFLGLVYRKLTKRVKSQETQNKQEGASK